METQVHVLEAKEEMREDQIHWAEAEWFQVWLQLARRDYHGHPDSRELKTNDAPIAA